MIDSLITPLQELISEAVDYQTFIDTSIPDDTNELVCRGSDNAMIISRTGKMLADAKYWKDFKQKSELMDKAGQLAREAGFSIAIINKLIDSMCRDENYAINWIERINKTATHQLDWIRTLISKAKEEMRLSGSMNHQ